MNLYEISCDFKQNGNFTLSFFFNQNIYFFNEELTKEFIVDSKNKIKKIISSDINWKHDDLKPFDHLTKKQINIIGTNTKQSILKKEEQTSFFYFFKNYTKEINVETENFEENEDNIYIEEEYDIGLFIKDELIPYSLEYYINLNDYETENNKQLTINEEGNDEFELEEEKN